MVGRSLRFAVLTLLVVLAAHAAVAQTFVFDLRGSQEVPPEPSVASAGCMGTLDQGAGQFALTCVHNVAGATVMHIHKGAPGVNGPILFDLGDPASPIVATWTGMTPQNIADLVAGDLYINIHTAGRPAGEIRGQILPRTVDSVAFTADGTQFVPPNSTSATAACTADLDNAATSLAVQCTHDVPAPTGAEIHEEPVGTNGPVVFTFSSPASPLSANIPMTPGLVADFAATFLALEIHSGGASEDTPGPQLRGQIGQPPAGPTTGTIRIVKRTTPAGASGFGFTDNVPASGGSFTLNDGGTQTFSNVPGGTYTIAENDPAPSGFALDDVACDDTDSTGNPFARTATIHLQPGELVTCTFRNLQTYTAPTSFIFHLSGDQEVPPHSTPVRGGCAAQFDAASSSLSIVCTHDVADATVMHIHHGLPGVNGAVLFDLGDPRSPVQAKWSGMSPADVADLLAGNLYVNIHTGGRPAGEIRGQILSRTVDNFTFAANGAQEVPPSASAATGNCSADLNATATSLGVQCSHNAAGATNARLFDAPPGANGPLVFDFPLADPFSGNVPMTPRLLADFAAGFLYVDVATTEVPTGEIRGQLIAGAAPATAEAVPTLAGWVALMLALMLVVMAWWRLR